MTDDKKICDECMGEFYGKCTHCGEELTEPFKCLVDGSNYKGGHFCRNTDCMVKHIVDELKWTYKDANFAEP